MSIINKVSLTVSTFYCCNIDNNGILEKKANYFLQPIRCAFLNGRKVTLSGQREYENIEEVGAEINYVTFFCKKVPIRNINDPQALLLAVAVEGALVAIYTIVGTALKLAAWLSNPSTLRNNIKLIQLRYQEIQNFKDPFTFPTELSVQIANKAKDSFQVGTVILNKLPPELHAYIIGFLDYPALVNLNQTSSYWFERCHRDQNFNHVRHKEVITRRFPKYLVDTIKCENFAQWTKMRMKAHRVSADPSNFQVQKMDSCLIEGGRNPITLLHPEEMRWAAITWGDEPIPFVAARVTYRSEDRRWMLGKIHRFLFRIGIAKTTFRKWESVIVLHQKSVNRWVFSQRQNPLYPIATQRSKTILDNKMYDDFMDILQGKPIQNGNFFLPKTPSRTLPAGIPILELYQSSKQK
jgi:hypothetical protein